MLWIVTKWPRKAYRELALLHHPDKGGSDGDFKLLRRAYEDGLIAVKRAEEAAYKPKPGRACPSDGFKMVPDGFRCFKLQAAVRGELDFLFERQG